MGLVTQRCRVAHVGIEFEDWFSKIPRSDFSLQPGSSQINLFGMRLLE
jgi:hypothetical protein